MDFLYSVANDAFRKYTIQIMAIINELDSDPIIIDLVKIILMVKMDEKIGK